MDFVPQLELGLWLARQPGVHAAMDVSDGVLLDLHTLLVASSNGSVRQAVAEVRPAAAEVVLGAALDRQAFVLAHPDDGLEEALCRGEDHVLLFTLAEGVALPASELWPEPYRRPVGTVDAKGGIRMAGADGVWQTMAPKGWQHGVPS